MWLFTQKQNIIGNYFGDVAFVTFFVVIASVSKFAFYSYFFSFGNIFFYNFGYFSPSGYSVPFGLFNFFTFVVDIIIICSKRDIGYFFPSPKVFTSGSLPTFPINCTLFFIAFMAFKNLMLLLFYISCREEYCVSHFRRCKVVAVAKNYSVDNRLLSFVIVCCRLLVFLQLIYSNLLLIMIWIKILVYCGYEWVRRKLKPCLHRLW